LSFLADDLFEGRGTGQRGGDLAVRYLETQAAASASNRWPTAATAMPVQIEGTKLLPTASYASECRRQDHPQNGSEIVFGTMAAKDITIDAPLVFVGYGAVAPEEKWDDYKGVDMKGKILVMMVNDPQPTAEEPTASPARPTPTTAAGCTSSKKRCARARPAADPHNRPRMTGACRQQLQPRALPPGRQRQSDRRLGAGRTGARCSPRAASTSMRCAQAERRDFRPVDLKLSVHAEIQSKVRQIEQYNVAGIVPGTDPS
jgi:hypothetical protein